MITIDHDTESPSELKQAAYELFLEELGELPISFSIGRLGRHDWVPRHKRITIELDELDDTDRILLRVFYYSRCIGLIDFRNRIWVTFDASSDQTYVSETRTYEYADPKFANHLANFILVMVEGARVKGDAPIHIYR